MEERSHPYYDIRDPYTGKFTKLNGKHIMTIEHSTHEVVQENLPALVQEDETVIRSTLSKFADGIVKLGSYAKTIDGLKADMDLLRGQITEANARLEDMRRERDDARAAQAKAEHDAKMAREAYDTVNAKRQEAETQVDYWSSKHDTLEAVHTKLQSDHSFRGDEITRLSNLLDLARSERDNHRNAEIELKAKLEEAEFKVLEFDEIKQNLDIAQRALDDCARTVVDWKGKAHSFETELRAKELEAQTHNDRANTLWNDVKAITEQRDKLVLTLEDIRRRIG